MAVVASGGEGRASTRLLGAGAVVVAIASIVVWTHRGAPEAPRSISTDRAETEPDRPPARERQRPDPALPAKAATASSPTAARAHPASPSADGPTTDEQDPLFGVRSASDDPTQKGTDALVASLHSADPVVVTEAAKALIARRATSAVGELAKIDLATAGGSALSIVDALGKLGAMADGSEKDAAVDRLLALLAEEKAHPGADSAAHLLQIYEALGETGDPKARGPLEAELTDPSVGRAPKVVIVGALVAIGPADSRAALEKARAQEASPVDGDPFEEEVRKELLAAIDKALATP